MRLKLIAAFCLIATAAHAQWPFSTPKEKEPPAYEAINIPQPTYETDLALATECIYKYEIFTRENDLKKVRRQEIEYQKETLNKCLSNTGDKYGDPAGFRAEARRAALARFPQPSPPVAKPAPQSAPSVAPAQRIATTQTRKTRAPDYNLPPPGPILARVQGKDEIDTAARRYAAANILHDLTRELAGTIAVADMPPGLARSNQEYLNASSAIKIEADKTYRNLPCDASDCPIRRFNDTAWEKKQSREFQKEVLATIPDEVRRFYFAAKDKQAAQIVADAQRAKAQQDAINARAPVATRRTQANDSSAPTWLLVVGGVGGLILLFALFGRGEKELPPLTDNYGTAAFASPPDTVADPSAAQKGVFLGKGAIPGVPHPLAHPFAPVFTTPENHTLIVARTRSGKGTRVIVPTLLRYGGSVITFDPKGENAAITARARQKDLGQDVHIINPWNQHAGLYRGLGLNPAATYNPLDLLDKDDPNVVAIAQSFAGLICPEPKGDREGYWQGSANELLCAILLWLTDQPNEKKTLGRARDIIGQSRKDMREKFLVKMATSDAFDGAIRNFASPFVDLAQETYSAVVSNLSVSTRFISDPQIKTATADSSFSMKHLMEGRTSVYIVLPESQMQAQAAWLRLIVNAAMQTFKFHYTGKRSQKRCLFLIDELGALGKLDELPRIISTISGHGVDLALVVQNIEQLTANYGEADAATILSNCGWKWFCNVNTNSSAKFVSDGLGEATVRKTTETFGEGESQNRGGGGSSSSYSKSFDEMARALLKPDEVQRLGRDFAVVFQPEGYPLFLRTIDYWNLLTAFAWLKNKLPKLFWEPPLNFDPNPFREDEPKKEPPPGGKGGGGQKQGRSDPPPGEDEGYERRRGRVRMTPEKARRILGVSETATREEILAAYKRHILRNHPDKGGSTEITQMLNEAKSVLLGE